MEYFSIVDSALFDHAFHAFSTSGLIIILLMHPRFSLLCITDDMEWVPASDGIIPPGRMPVEGGFEETGEKLYHALDKTSPSYAGKTAPHVGTFFPLLPCDPQWH
jgi:hypothetical protein